MGRVAKTSIVFCLFLACHLFGSAGVQADNARSDRLQSDKADKPLSVNQRIAVGWGDGPEDEKNKLAYIRNRAKQTNGLIPISPLQPLRDKFTKFNNALYDATHLKLGLSLHTAVQGATEAVPGSADFGGATDMDFVGTWELFNRGEPTLGELYFLVEGRWNYGPIGPQSIGFVSLASAGGTANTYSKYTPTFILRNIYYKQGGKEAGWVYRFGKISPDAMLGTSPHINPNGTFLPNAGTGFFSNALPDSGLGAAGAVYFGENTYLAGVVSDSNGNRFDFGDIGAGDFYKALEFGTVIAPHTANPGQSKFIIWHTDGTKDGTPINGMTGASGWGFAVLLTQELSADGKTVLLARYGRSFNGAAIFDQQVGVHLVLYEPTGAFENDAIGAAFNWIDSASPGTRNEYSLEAFYRFPLSPAVDTTIAYQGVFTPAFTRAFDYSSVFTLRLVTSF